jgi:hypothetical protein
MMRSEMIWHRAANFCSVRSSLLASVGAIEFRAVEEYSGLGLTGVIYIDKLLRVDNQKIAVRIKPNALTD